MGAEERSENLDAQPILPRVDSTAPFSGTFHCHLFGDRNPKVETFLRNFHARKTNCDAESYHCHRGQISSLWVWSTLQHTYHQTVPSPWTHLLDTRVGHIRGHRHLMPKVRNFSGVNEEVVPSSHLHDEDPLC